MEKYTFIVSKETQEFVSIIKVDDNNLNSFVGLDLDLYSALTTDEQTARANFTLTNHLAISFVTDNHNHNQTLKVSLLKLQLYQALVLI